MISTIAFGPNIISPNESIFYVDAANPSSYPENGNIWTDLTQYKAIGSFYSSSNAYQPIYNSANGGSISFNGNTTNGDGSIINFSQINNLKSTIGYNFTVNTWVKPTNITNQYGVVAACRYFTGPIPVSYEVIFQMMAGNASSGFPNQFLFLHQWGAGGGAAIATASYTPGNWYNVVGVRNGNTSSIYLNGVFQSSQSTPAGTPYASDPYISVGAVNVSSFNNPGATWYGNVASVNIYNRVLSNDEILQNFNAVRNRFGV